MSRLSVTTGNPRQASQINVTEVTGVDRIELTATGQTGQPGPPGAPGTPGPPGATSTTAWYNWQPLSLAPSQPMSPGSLTIEPGDVVGPDIPAAGEYSTMHIAQIDAEGFNCGYFTVAPGQLLMVRDTEGGLHQMTATGRYASASGEVSYVGLDYVVISTTGTPVQGRQVEVSLLAAPAGGSDTGGGGVVTKEFGFALPVLDWTIVHLMGTAIEVNCYDPTGTYEYDPEIEIVDETTAIVHWYYPTAGIARVLG
jgi:hypothetical protein